MTTVHIKGRLYGLRAFGHQLDYRPDGWLPFSVRNGLRKDSRYDWRVLSLGRLGCITFARIHPMPRPKGDTKWTI